MKSALLSTYWAIAIAVSSYLLFSHHTISHTHSTHSPGNYVVQQVFVCGDEDHRAAVLETLTREDSLLKFSKHKYASNVVETVLMHGEAHHKERIVQGILKVSNQQPNHAFVLGAIM